MWLGGREKEGHRATVVWGICVLVLFVSDFSVRGEGGVGSREGIISCIPYIKLGMIFNLLVVVVFLELT